MDEAKTIPLDQAKKGLSKLSREQRRAIERVNQEVSDTLAKLVNIWWEFFLNNDPESEAVKAKQKEVSAKWKVYCSRRKVKAELFSLADRSISDLIEEYRKANPKPEPPKSVTGKAKKWFNGLFKK